MHYITDTAYNMGTYLFYLQLTISSFDLQPLRESQL
jgi:hypothetical protein